MTEPLAVFAPTLASALALFTPATLASVAGLALLAFAVGGVVGLLYRLYIGSRVPFYAPVIVGLGVVGLWINSANALVLFISGIGEEAIEPVVITNIEANTAGALVAGLTAYAGGLVGDALTPNVRALVGARQVNTEVSRIVRTVGRFITVTVPDEIQTIDGYDPVTDETRTKLAGLELVFPRGLTVRELRERITTRLREDYGVGYVDVEVDEDGEVTYLALGRRVAGIGPTLPPRRVALALTANPAPKASPGDLVQLWELPEAEDGTEEAVGAAGEESERAADAAAAAAAVESAEATPVEGDAANGEGPRSADGDGDRDGDDLPAALLAHPDRWYRPESERYAFAVRTPEGERRYRQTAESAAALVAGFYGDAPSTADDGPPRSKRVAQAELRAVAGDAATVVVDVNRLEYLDQSREYRLVTLPSDVKPEQEFASLLRAANETMEVVRVVAGSPLTGLAVGALRPRVLAVKPRDEGLVTLPDERRRCAPGDRLYVISRQDQLRKLSNAAAAGDGDSHRDD